MDPSSDAPSLDDPHAEASFRKPSRDAAARKYRRHPSSDEDDDKLKRERVSRSERRSSPVRQNNGHRKDTESRRQKDDHDFGTDRTRYSDRYSNRMPRESGEYDGRRYHDRQADDEWIRGRNRERDHHYEHNRYEERDRAISGRKQAHSNSDFDNARNRDRLPVEDERRDRCKGSRKYGDEYDEKPVEDERRDRYKGARKYGDEYDEKPKRRNEEIDDIEKGKRPAKESWRPTEDESRREASLVNNFADDKKLGSSAGKALAAVVSIDKMNSKHPDPGDVQTGGSTIADTAKFAAMKAAELVNRNISGVGVAGPMTADQKRKMLWGNKKNNTLEESAKQWNLTLFSDRERQEKFNKLMNLRMPWCLWPIVGCEG